MRKLSWIIAGAAVSCAVILGADWPTLSGGPQRDSWARSEKTLTKENVGGLQLLYKYQADNQWKGLNALTPPIIDGLLITYLGFKEMLVFGGSADNVYSVDADLNRLIWKRHFEGGAEELPKKETLNCPGGLTAAVAMEGSSSAGVSFGRRRPQAGEVQLIGGSGFGSLGAFFAVSSDGSLHALNPSTGADLLAAAKFVPPNSRLSALNVHNNMVYAATLGDCGGKNALYALDPSSKDNKAASFPTKGSEVAGMGGTALGSDGTVYIQIASGTGDEPGAYNDTVLALEPRTLKVKDYFTRSGPASEPGPTATPMVFSYKGRDFVVAGGADGRLYLLDSASLGGAGHHTPLFQTEVIAHGGFRGAFASWNNADSETRWVYASLSGPVETAIFPEKGGDAPNGGVAGFKMMEQSGALALVPAWISGDMLAPAPAVVANGMVFAVGTGEPASEYKKYGKPYREAAFEKASKPATLYVLDGATGKQLYSSGDTVSAPAHNGALAIANGRVYFTTNDNNVYSFGFKKDNPQLTER